MHRTITKIKTERNCVKWVQIIFEPIFMTFLFRPKTHYNTESQRNICNFSTTMQHLLDNSLWYAVKVCPLQSKVQMKLRRVRRLSREKSLGRHNHFHRTAPVYAAHVLRGLNRPIYFH